MIGSMTALEAVTETGRQCAVRRAIKLINKMKRAVLLFVVRQLRTKQVRYECTTKNCKASIWIPQNRLRLTF